MSTLPTRTARRWPTPLLMALGAAALACGLLFWRQGATARNSAAAHPPEGHASPIAVISSVALSERAYRNLGLTPDQLQPIRLSDYWQAITMPAMVVARPGRTQLNVSTPLTGVIEHVHAAEGESVLPGSLLFEIRLTHEDLVNAQVEYLKTLGEIDVERQELSRLEPLAEQGGVAGKSLLERRYAVEKLEALLSAQRESLRLHGLTDKQVARIAADRKLLRELQIFAPSPDEHDHAEDYDLINLQEQSRLRTQSAGAPAENGPPLTLHELHVHKGQSVTAGETLCLLADFRELYIEGAAFERDAPAVLRALEQGWPVSAVFEAGQPRQHAEENLRVQFVDHAVDPRTRTLKFFLPLANEIVRDTTDDEGRRFVAWRRRPGQRLQLRLPLEEWKQQIVVPAAAVARDGAENYVFVQNGAAFDRIPVHVRHRDSQTVVLAHDGAVFPGDVIALRGAHQLQMAIQNLSGGAIDPHAGHNH